MRLTLARGGERQAEETLKALVLDPRNRPRPPGALIVVQLLVGLGAMVGGAHLFVEELLGVADRLGVEALVLSLVLAPLATELPEKANSFFWVREGKDALALGNITGAMVFQSTIPIAIGLLLTGWELDRFAVLSMILGLAGGARRLLGPAPAGPVQRRRDRRLERALRGLPRLRDRQLIHAGAVLAPAQACKAAKPPQVIPACRRGVSAGTGM